MLANESINCALLGARIIKFQMTVSRESLRDILYGNTPTILLKAFLQVIFTSF